MSSRASISSTCAMPAIRSRRRSPMTRPAPTSSPSSTSPRATRIAASCSMWCAVRRRLASCRSRSAAACAPSMISAPCSPRAPTRCRSTPRRWRAAPSSRKRRRNSATNASWSRSTPRRYRSRAKRTAGKFLPMAAAIRPGSMPRLCARGGRARRRRNPAHLDGSRRHAARLSISRSPAPSPMRYPSRLSPRAASAISITWSRASATAMPARCWPRRSFISASIPCARPRTTWPSAGLPVRLDP